MINLITKMTCITLGLASMTMAQDIVITQNPNCDTDAESAVACGGEGTTAENWFARNIAIDQDATINSITWGAANATSVTASFTFSVASGPGNPDGVTLTPVGSASQAVDAGPFYTTAVDMPFEVAAGSYLVVEVQFPDTGADPGIWPASTTTATGETYIMSDECGLTGYSDVTAIGFPESQVIMCLNATLGDFDPCDLPLPATCAADVDGDGSVAVSDVLAIIGQWGDCGDGSSRPSGDVAPMPNGDCCVTVADVLAVVGSWGADCTVYGACCYGDGACASTSMDDCSAGGGAWSADASCADISCTAAACCFSDNSCSDLTEASCTALGGDYKGDGTACAATDCSAVAAGDECSSAIVVVDGANAFDHTDMTGSTPDPDETACTGPFAMDWLGCNDGWYVYQSTGGLTTFDTCDATSYDTSMVLYEDSCTNQVWCNGDSDDDTGCQQYHSTITYDCVAGATYYIRIGEWDGGVAGTTGTLNINPPPSGNGACCFPDETCLDLDAGSCAAFEGIFQGDGTGCSPENPCLAGPGDECASAVEAFEGANPFDTTMMTPSEPAPDDTDCADTYLEWGDSNDAWLYWVAPSGGTATFSACDAASYDTSMVLYEGTCDNQVACNGDTTGEDGCQLYYSAVYDYPVTAGTTYYVRMGGWQADSGAGTVTISLIGGDVVGACCMDNGSCMDYNSDDCANAGGTWSSSAMCADTDCPAPYAGCPAGAESNCDPCYVDNDDSTADCNGGLNAVPVAYQAITLGVPVCGTGSVFFDGGAQGTYRDLDWFTNASLNAGGTFTVSAGSSGMDALFGVVDNTAGTFVAAYVMPGGYEGSAVFADLPAGDYSVLIGPSDWNLEWTCDSGLVDYWVQLD
jgi:hypothetical protein